ncbi:MAG: YebC/PmpR family DNA-binding transcriptional regulator [Candidatus Coatesbacteria bacterium]|nr:MAG: YebC/PmpR family DNA-binding transcriptional regulator [Candidatus Coatesbacteria bacterium]
MSGHSKWSTIKRKKAAQDAKKGKIFSKLIREITIASKLGGGDEESNPRLRMAVQSAKEANMPKENIERAIKRGTGELPGVEYEELTLEAYGPCGVAILIDALTDNRNRTVGEIRYILDKFGGRLAESGSTIWNFERKGLVVVEGEGVDIDKLLDTVIEAGADDVLRENDLIEIYSNVEVLNDVIEAVDRGGYSRKLAEISMVPKTTVRLEGKDAEKLLNLLNNLEDQDDVQKVWTNFDIPDEIITALAEA